MSERPASSPPMLRLHQRRGATEEDEESASEEGTWDNSDDLEVLHTHTIQGPKLAGAKSPNATKNSFGAFCAPESRRVAI